MDTDEADRITRNVYLRTQQRRASSDGEDTLVGSDMERTMVEKKAQQQETKKETKKRVDNTKGIRNPETYGDFFEQTSYKCFRHF